MKLYIISGLGAGFKVLEKIKFNAALEIHFIDWLIPTTNESFQDYVLRMAEFVDETEDYFLLGYSFGGILVQEIHKLKPAKKVVIMGSIKSDSEKSMVLNAGRISRVNKLMPTRLYSSIPAETYGFVRKFFDPSNSKFMELFEVRDPYYLKWSVDSVLAWKMEALPDIVQILGEKDIIFPLKYSHPDYIIKGGTHLFPYIKHKEVSTILAKEFEIIA